MIVIILCISLDSTLIEFRVAPLNYNVFAVYVVLLIPPTPASHDRSITIYIFHNYYTNEV